MAFALGISPHPQAEWSQSAKAALQKSLPHLGLPRRGRNGSQKHSSAGTMAGPEFFANPFPISMLDRLSDILVICRPLLGFMSGPLGPLLRDKILPLCDRQHQCRHCMHAKGWRNEIQIKDASNSRLQFLASHIFSKMRSKVPTCVAAC